MITNQWTPSMRLVAEKSYPTNAIGLNYFEDAARLLD